MERRLDSLAVGEDGVTRRRVLVTTAGTALGAALAACGGDSGSSAGSGGGYGAPEGTADAGGGASSPTGSPTDPPAGSPAAGGHELARVADVPVGGATATEDSEGNPVIVAQPRRGEVVAFSAVCTHMGCTVAPDGPTLRCPCHGSTFEAATGENTGGPAPKPLPEVRVSVVDGVVVEV